MAYTFVQRYGNTYNTGISFYLNYLNGLIYDCPGFFIDEDDYIYAITSQYKYSEDTLPAVDTDGYSIINVYDEAAQFLRAVSIKTFNFDFNAYGAWSTTPEDYFLYDTTILGMGTTFASCFDDVNNIKYFLVRYPVPSVETQFDQYWFSSYNTCDQVHRYLNKIVAINPNESTNILNLGYTDSDTRFTYGLEDPHPETGHMEGNVFVIDAYTETEENTNSVYKSFIDTDSNGDIYVAKESEIYGGMIEKYDSGTGFVSSFSWCPELRLPGEDYSPWPYEYYVFEYSCLSGMCIDKENEYIYTLQFPDGNTTLSSLRESITYTVPIYNYEKPVFGNSSGIIKRFSLDGTPDKLLSFNDTIQYVFDELKTNGISENEAIWENNIVLVKRPEELVYGITDQTLIQSRIDDICTDAAGNFYVVFSVIDKRNYSQHQISLQNIIYIFDSTLTYLGYTTLGIAEQNIYEVLYKPGIEYIYYNPYNSFVEGTPMDLSDKSISVRLRVKDGMFYLLHPLLEVDHLGNYIFVPIIDQVSSSDGPIITPTLPRPLLESLSNPSQPTTISIVMPTGYETATIYWKFSTDVSYTEYIAPIQLDGPIGNIALADYTISAYAEQTDYNNSEVATKEYHIAGTVEEPVIYPGSSEFYPDVEITITCQTADAVIYYQINNGTPIQYTEAFTIDTTATITAFATKTGWLDSSEAEETYTIVYTEGALLVPVSYNYSNKEFTVKITLPEEVNLVSAIIDWGDGTDTGGPTPIVLTSDTNYSHTYSENGVYTVRLIAQFSDGGVTPILTDTTDVQICMLPIEASSIELTLLTTNITDEAILSTDDKYQSSIPKPLRYRGIRERSKWNIFSLSDSIELSAIEQRVKACKELQNEKSSLYIVNGTSYIQSQTTLTNKIVAMATRKTF